MSTAICPHCGGVLRIDDPLGDDASTEMECRGCGHTVVVTASVSVCYEAMCLDGEHDIVPVERHPGMEKCTRCEYFGMRSK